MVKENFIEYIRFEKRYSQHTIQAYTKDLSQYTEYLSEQFGMNEPGEAGHQQIRSWMVHLMEKGLSERTVLRKISSLKSFYRYLQRMQFIEHNPALLVISPKTPSKNPAFVEEEKMQDLFENISFGNDLSGVRDKLIIHIFYSTGVRLAELIGLKEDDISLGQKTMKVFGKRNKERIIPFTSQTATELETYLEMKRAGGFAEGGYLFLTDRGEKLYPRMVYRIVNKYLSMVTTMSRKSPHVLRHTFATHMLNRGADLNAIKEFLGHANLAATQVYTHNTVEKLKSIYRQAHPRA